MTFIKVMWKGVKKSSLVGIIKNRNNRNGSKYTYWPKMGDFPGEKS